MKKLKFFFCLFSIALVLNSCADEISDKLCDIEIKNINEEYDDLVAEVRNDSSLSEEEKTYQISVLNDERAEEIAYAEDECESLI